METWWPVSLALGRSWGWLWAVLLRDVEVLRAYRVARTPTYILLDGKGVVTWVSDGPLQGRDLGEEGERALRRAE